MTEPTSADPSAPAWINDAHWGQGGRYVFDPATGHRTRQDDAGAVATPHDAETETEQQPPPMKGKKHG